MLREAVQLIDQWTADTAQLTGVFWQWRSGPFRDEVLGWLRDRISHVLETRSVVQSREVQGELIFQERAAAQ